MTTFADLLDLPRGAAADGEIPMWIDGRPATSANGSAAARDDICPSTGSLLARVHQASAADVDRAVAAAASAQPAWAAMGVHERAARLAEWGRRVEVRYPGLPFGGWKQSGIGKELGLVDDILSYTRSKSISVAISPALLA